MSTYIQVLNEKVHRTVEIQEDILLADYSEDGRLVGVEILAPVAVEPNFTYRDVDGTFTAPMKRRDARP